MCLKHILSPEETKLITDVFLFIKLSNRRVLAHDMVLTACLDDSMVYLCFYLFIFANLFCTVLGGNNGLDLEGLKVLH